MDNFFEDLKSLGFVPVIKINDSKNAVGLARALAKGGLKAAEITFRSDAAEASIKAIAENVLDVCVCAGTVLTVDNAKRAVEAGAKAIISPGTNMDVVDWCIENKVTVIPGCATPTEIEACTAKGLKVVKLFPAEVVGGVKMLKALSGPYADVKFMPTGGINAGNVGSYLELKNVIACGGSWMVPEKLIDNQEFDEITKMAQAASDLVKEYRG